MASIIISKPAPDEYTPAFAEEIELVSTNDLLDGLRTSFQTTMPVLRALTEEQAGYRYAPGKWSVKQLWQHVVDIERVMSYRALRYARQDKTILESLDVNAWGEASGADGRPFQSILQEHEAVRASTLALFESFPEPAFYYRGTTKSSTLSVRALGYVVLGHEKHHLNVVRERYLGGTRA